MGIQGSVLERGIDVINKMITWRLEDESETPDEYDLSKFDTRRAKIFLGFCSSIVTSGCRDLLRYIFENRMVSISVTTAGGVEEDLTKCFGDYITDTYTTENCVSEGEQGLERQGNMLIKAELR